MKTIKNDIALLGSLLAVFILGGAGCEYYTTKPSVVQAQPVEQEAAVAGHDSQDEVIAPQTTPADPKLQELQDLKAQYDAFYSQWSGMADENASLRAELEKEKRDLEKAIADLQAELEKDKADNDAPKPDTESGPYHVLKPRVGMVVPEIPEVSMPPQEEIAKLVLGDAVTELDQVGGNFGEETEAFSTTMNGVDCAINKIVTDSSAVLDHISFSFEEPENIAKGVKGFYDRDVSFGGVPNGNRTTIIPPPQYVFTGFIAYVCPRPKGWDLFAKADGNDRVICGFRPIAKKMERIGLVDDVESLWIGPAVGTTSVTTGDLLAPKTVHTIASGDDGIKTIVASGKSSKAVIDGMNTFAYETCPAGQVLSGFKGAADVMVTRLIGICRPIAAQ